MKYFSALISVVLCAYTGVAQMGEEVGPLTGNPVLQAKGKKSEAKINVGTFDSTFIYTSDTIDLPFFDEFSSNNFQTYNAGYGDVGVTSDQKFRLLDNVTSVPLPEGVFYTEQQTFRRTVDLEAGTITDVNFPPSQIKVGDLSEYPVVYATTNVYPPYYIYDTLEFTAVPDPSPDTVWIVGPEIFQDSATQFFATINDSTLLWLEDEAYHNYTMAKDPWSLGVVTFDGLDENGYPYAFGSTTTNYADHLTSKPIDMSVVDASDSIYFSFMTQSEGLCDPPEAIDSLILEFYAEDLNQWNHVWSMSGGSLDTFRLTHIPVLNGDYFKRGFQFRFKNYGGLSGSLDHFHLDYVHLGSIPGVGGYVDTSLRDVAFSYPINTLLEDYTSVPWDHYKNLVTPSSVMTDSMPIIMANSFPGDIGANDGITEVYYNAAFEGSTLLISDFLCDNVNDNYFGNSIPHSNHDIAASYVFDQTKPGISQTFDMRSAVTAGATNFAGNDSTWSQQVFENYYSYDDGSAELAYGTTGAQSRLAIQYTPYEADSLIGVMIHFVPSVVDVSDKLFLLTVWDDNNGKPGNVLYEDDIFFPRSPEYKFQRNIFTYYFLADTMKLPINGTFYIGWRQFDPERLNVGLDMNIVNNDKTFYSVDNGVSWDQSSFPGSVMIRPVFSTGMDVSLAIKTIEDDANVLLYPNPTTSEVTISMDGTFDGVEVYNVQGRMLMRSEESTVDLSGHPKGMYFFKIDGVSRVYKVIKD